MGAESERVSFGIMASGQMPDELPDPGVFREIAAEAETLGYDDLGLCPKGEGGPYLADRKARPDGDLPLNTDGGGLSHCHPGMLGMNLLLEAVAQLRGTAGDRLVAGARRSLVHGLGGVQAANATAVLANRNGVA